MPRSEEELRREAAGMSTQKIVRLIGEREGAYPPKPTRFLREELDKSERSDDDDGEGSGPHILSEHHWR